MELQRHRLRARSLLIVVGLTVSVVIAVPAGSASASHGLLCVYEHSSWHGRVQCFDRNGGNVGPTLDNQVSSVRNDLGISMCMYDLRGQLGYFLPILSHSRYRNLALNAAPDGRSWNDRISSTRATPC